MGESSKLIVDWVMKPGASFEAERETFVASLNGSDTDLDSVSSEGGMTPMISARGYAAKEANTPLVPYQFERREPRERDVVIEIQYCGVCHSDLHQVKGEFQPSGLWTMLADDIGTCGDGSRAFVWRLRMKSC